MHKNVALRYTASSFLCVWGLLICLPWIILWRGTWLPIFDTTKPRKDSKGVHVIFKLSTCTNSLKASRGLSVQLSHNRGRQKFSIWAHDPALSTWAASTSKLTLWALSFWVGKQTKLQTNWTILLEHYWPWVLLWIAQKSSKGDLSLDLCQR